MIEEIADDIRRGHARGVVPTDVWLARDLWLQLVDEILRLDGACNGYVVIPSWFHDTGARETIVRPFGGEA